MNQLDYKGKRVLMRVDFNVPIEDGEISDDTRIRAALPTIKNILDHEGTVLLLSHLGRPQKKKLPDGSIDVKKFSLRPVAQHLGGLLDRSVTFIEHTSGEAFIAAAKEVPNGGVALVENTRFEKGESSADPNLSQEWASVADLFINDAFGTAHRNHASNAGVAAHFDKSSKSFGLLIQNELKAAEKVLHNPAKPFTAILGGAKVSDKISLIENLLDKADNILVGGGMAYTFIKALDGDIGNSLVEEEKIGLACDLLAKAQKKDTRILLPIDSICADNFSEDAASQECLSHEIPEGWMGLDIGSRAIEDFEKVILNSKTICWNGPMGVFEFEKFAQGTKRVAELVAQATDTGSFTLIGGGDSVAAINQMGLAEEVSYVSTGGGAMLTLLEGGPMPGITSIEE